MYTQAQNSTLNQTIKNGDLRTAKTTTNTLSSSHMAVMPLPSGHLFTRADQNLDPSKCDTIVMDEDHMPNNVQSAPMACR